MLVKLTEVCGSGAITTGRKYSLREVFVNPEHVVMVREDNLVVEEPSWAERRLDHLERHLAACEAHPLHLHHPRLRNPCDLSRHLLRRTLGHVHSRR